MIRWNALVIGAALLLTLAAGCSSYPDLLPLVVFEQRSLSVREPVQIPHPTLPDLPPPDTVSTPRTTGIPKELSLDEAVRISLENARVIRVLAGTDVVSSGKTIYDPAVANTAIDAAKSTFDPVFTANNTFSRTDTPLATFDPTTPAGASILASQVDNYQLGLGISKKLVTGGTLGLNETLTTARYPGSLSTFNLSNAVNAVQLGTAVALNPQAQSGLALNYTQPLLQGAGIDVNVAPIVIAGIKTELSFFQLKDNVQELVRGTIEAYWAVVFARTDAWARRQQVEQGEYAFARADARKKAGFGSSAEVAQADVALSNFRASLITAEANLLQREAVLQNILGIPPTEYNRFTPITAPTPVQVEPKWDQIVRLAEEMRPDLIELNLILEADQQNLTVARNQTLPQLNATMQYQWNGLEGTAPDGQTISTSPGQFTSWSVGINFSVPLGLRQGRANMRNAELLIMSDRANIEQAGHAAIYSLQTSVRNLASYFEQYKAYQRTRTSARINLEQQIADFRSGRVIFLNVLQAITDWGNAVSSEAQALAQYNTELANLEKQTGTILESHGVQFMEDRFRSLGPLGRLGPRPLYPLSSPPSLNSDRYPDNSGPPEKSLDKDRPTLKDLPTAPKDVLPQGQPTPQRTSWAPPYAPVYLALADQGCLGPQAPRSASRTASMNARTRAGSFRPGLLSTPLATSTA
jgi:outer membrane protein TolC